MRMHSPVKRYMLARPVSLAVAWAVALALCGTESTLAQDEEEDEPIVLVSNTEEDADAPTYSFSIREIVQYFTTGSNAAGYGLTSIDFAAVSPSHPNDTFMTFSLHRHREGSVWGPTIATLPDAGPIVEGTNTFTLSARLAPNTEYALSIREQAYHVTLSRTSSHDEDSDHGWTLANDITEILFAGRSHKLDDGPLRMKIRGHVLEVSDPGRPAGLTATASDGGIDLSWTAPEHDGGREISGYRIEVSSDGGASWSDLVADTGNAETTYRHAGLATGDIRHYRVSAVNAEGTGPPSDVATATLYLVSNADQAGDGRSDTSLRRVQRFTAGAVATGLAATDYKLTEVELESVDYEFDDLSVAVYAVDQDGSPDELHASLTGPDTPRRGTLVFAAQSDTTLVAGTTYALVIESPGGESVQLATTTSHSEDAGSAAGWSLADGHQVEGEDDVWRNATPTAALRIAVRGFELTTTRPPPPPPPPPPPGPDTDPEPDPDPDPDPPPPPSGPLKASFTVDVDCPNDLCRALTDKTVRFVDTSTGPVRTRAWSFGDGGNARARTADRAWDEPGFYTVTLTVGSGDRESTASRTFLVEASLPAGTCVADRTTLCLQRSRFAVRIDWWTLEGEAGDGVVVREGTDDSGMFWFFDSTNWETLIKVLDGCALNEHVWVYGASTTDVGYRIVVTDTVTGKVREYRSELGAPAPAIADSAAFPDSCER